MDVPVVTVRSHIGTICIHSEVPQHRGNGGPEIDACAGLQVLPGDVHPELDLQDVHADQVQGVDWYSPFPFCNR